ncbi:MAG: TolC family protein [Nitrospirae bacterium]|nr:TolC family protein [Nitrospirota bacterium]
MIKLRLFFIAYALIFFIHDNTLAVQQYSLAELYSLALERSETIQIAAEEIYISGQGKDKAMSKLLPTLSAFGTHTRYSDEKMSSFSVLQPDHSTSWGVRLDQSLSLGRREIISYNSSKDNILKSRHELERVKEDYLLSIAASYYDVLKSKEALGIAKANIERLIKHRDAAAIRLKVGEATKTVVLRAEAELSGAQSDMIKAENNLKIAKITLARLAGIDGEYELREDLQPSAFSLQPLTVDCQLPAIDCLKGKALSERVELKSIAIEKTIAESDINYAKGSYWPTVSVEGVYSRKEDRPSSFFAVDETIYGGIKLNFPFFEGGLRRAEVRETKSRLKQVEYRLSDLKDSINVEVENAYLNMATESGVLSKLQAQVAYAKDNFNAVSKQFEHGLANTIDVIDANTLLVNAERELSNAKLSYELSVLQLYKATGALLKSVLASQPSVVSQGN